jgi:hypothetical protein
LNRLLFAVIGYAAASICPGAMADDGAPLLDVVGTTFRVSTPGQPVLEAADLVGAVLTMVVDGEVVRARLESVAVDDADPKADILLYDLRLIDDDGSERPLCRPDPGGRTVGFPIAGRTDETGALRPADPGAFEFVCTAGAQGKCVRLGYAPWRTEFPDGRSLIDHYNACVHMIRADYCGDGRSFTRDGALIGVADRIGVNNEEHGDLTGLRFEAAWGPDGALCVARPRLEDLDSAASLARTCPALVGRVGPDQCDPGRRDALILNYSR